MFAGQYDYLFSCSVFVIGLTAFIAVNMSCEIVSGSNNSKEL